MPDDRKDDKRATVDIQLLQTFHLVARTGSFSAAARELNISYQSAANHVRRLEQKYGTRLVEAEKGSRTVVLTQQGKALHASLGNELDTIFARISVLIGGMHSLMRVGVPQALFHHFFPRIIARFRARAPDMQLVFFERDTALENMMLSGELDACISERFFGQATVSQILLGEYKLNLVYPSAWAAQETEPLTLADFADRPLITYEPGQTIRSRSVDFLAEAFGAPPRITTTVSGSTSVKALVDEGLGYAVVPEWMVDRDSDEVSRIVLEEVRPVKVYFGCSAFLASNEYLRMLQELCRAEMGFNGADAGRPAAAAQRS